MMKTQMFCCGVTALTSNLLIDRVLPAELQFNGSIYMALMGINVRNLIDHETFFWFY